MVKVVSAFVRVGEVEVRLPPVGDGCVAGQGFSAGLVVDRDRVGEDHRVYPVRLRCVGERQAGQDGEHGALRRTRLGSVWIS